MRCLGGWLAIGAVTAIVVGSSIKGVSAAEVPQTTAVTKTTPTAETGWAANFEEAQKTAKQLGVPLLLHFHATWCGPCQQMERTVLNAPAVTGSLGRRVVAVKINTDHRPDLTSRFDVGGLPCDVFLTPDGQPLSRSGAVSHPASYQRQIIQVSQRYFAKRLYDLIAGGSNAKSAGTAQASHEAASDEVALEGFSPVAIVEKKQWQAGSEEFAHTHNGKVYHLSSAEELARFKSAPDKFVPGWLGHDPLEVLPALQSVTGDIRFAAFFRNRLYLLSSEANRKKFLENPAVFEDLGK